MNRTPGEGELAGTAPSHDRDRDHDHDRTPPIPSSLCSRSRELTDAAADISFGALLDADIDIDIGTDTDTDTATHTRHEPRIQWATPDGLEIVGRGVAARFTATGPTRFDDVREQAARTFEALEYDGPAVARPRAFGGLSFHDSFESSANTATDSDTDRESDSATDATPTTAPWHGFTAASFVVPQVLVVRSDETTWLTAVSLDADTATQRLDDWHDRLADSSFPAMRSSGSPPGVTDTERTTSRAAWVEQVEDAIERIETTTLRKVVLAQSLSVGLDAEIDVPATLERLRRRYPNCYRFLIDHSHAGSHDASGTFFGAPPERLVSKRGEHVETEALAGSAPRGETPEADEEFADQLRDCEKVQHEHVLVAEAIRDQLTPVTSSLTTDDQQIRRLATIQHIRTPIEATLDDEVTHVLELVEALHPTPAVGGMPPDQAWETIHETEPFDRGWYAAPIGWFDGNGDGEFAVALRSGVATDERVTLFAGSGLVADSDPHDEWDEVQLKFRPILDELRPEKASSDQSETQLDSAATETGGERPYPR
ncbi:isochorismate synthase [Natrialba chahannaoensis JCM 10990]|uniref:isochorismate synthase n=1 Tax=Natrialba chahannaoensis JCM 10990 TaxID=1227492 RepID=M0AK72_9EURY|nr:isochorismate synthase [Natrialba chahannaoensis]ELY99080.1 isochorismate synthase [Natrialba chahannaoensis JCM 10990]